MALISSAFSNASLAIFLFLSRTEKEDVHLHFQKKVSNYIL